MKKSLLSSAIAAGLFAVCLAWICSHANQASAQAPVAPAASAQGSIALIDVNYIFKKHVRLKAQLTELQKEAEKVQQGFETQLKDLQEQSKALGTNNLKPGSPEYQSLEERLVTMKANIQGQIALKRKEFVQKEAHLYFNAYREISDEVTYFCQQRGIALVLNFNGDSIHEDNPDDVARGISKKVVFYNKSLDITPYVLPRFAPPQGTGTPDASRTNSPVGVFPQR